MAKPKGELDIYIGDSRLYTVKNPFEENAVNDRPGRGTGRGGTTGVNTLLRLSYFLRVPPTRRIMSGLFAVDGVSIERDWNRVAE